MLWFGGCNVVVSGSLCQGYIQYGWCVGMYELSRGDIWFDNRIKNICVFGVLYGGVLLSSWINVGNPECVYSQCNQCRRFRCNQRLCLQGRVFG